MSRKKSGRSASPVLSGFRNWFGKSRSSLVASRSPQRRPLGFESLEGRTVLSITPGATILGTAFNDLTNNGLTADDTALVSTTIKLFRDGGNGTFQGAGAGSDDMLVGTTLTNGQGKYAFTALNNGTYFVQEVVPAGYNHSPPVTKVVIDNAHIGTVGIPIDSFQTNQLVDASSLGVTLSASSIAAPEAIGGHRDLLAQLTSAKGNVNLASNAFDQHLLEYNSSATGAGNRFVTWDGDNSANPAVLNPTGLNHVDLTNGGTNSGITVAIGADHDNGLVTFRVYKDANNWSTASMAIPNTGGGAASEYVFLPYASFTTGGGTGAGNFTDVGAIQMRIEGNSAVNGQVGVIGTVGPAQYVTNLYNYLPASVGDLVFWDLNKNGIQDANDPGAANVTVQLLQGDAIVGTTTTDAQGKYQFTNLTPGDYHLRFVTASGTLFTQKNQGGAAVDSDADPATGLTSVFSLTSGQNDTSRDAGLLPIDLTITKAVNNPTPTVGSTVTFTITLNNASGYSQATGVTVNDVLPAGLTFVSATPAGGTTYNSNTGVWNIGSLASGATTSLTITANVTNGGTKTNTAIVASSVEPDVGTIHQASASVTPPASVGNFVFWDLNTNGVQDASEPGAPGVAVQLLKNGAVVGTTTTDAQGAYKFDLLAPGQYSLKFVPANGAVFTQPTQGGNTALDSDVNPATGTTAVFSLASGENNTSLDAGLKPINLSISKTVNNATPPVGSNVTFTIMVNNAGSYSPATGVSVNDVLPTGLTFVAASPSAGTNFNSNTGVWAVGNLASGASATLTITATVTSGGTKTNTAIVAGADEPDVGTIHQASASVTPPASLGDFVFWDLAKNGVQDASDPGAAGVTVQLLQNGSVVGTTTTNAQGAYNFDGVAPGQYSLKFIPTGGAVFTTQNQGGNPALDSDADPSTGTTSVFTVVSGQNDTSHDAGLLPINLGITKAVDDSTPHVGDNVVFTITLSNASGYSPATGVVVNDLLPAGLSFVSASPGAGTTYNSTSGVWNIGNLASGASKTLTITAHVVNGGEKTNVAQVAAADEPDVGTVHQASASVVPPASIGNLVFWDLAKNGIQDEDDLGAGNVTVQLLQNGQVVATTTTNDHGEYQFDDINPGVYSIKFIPQNGAVFTLKNQGANPDRDSDADAAGLTSTFTVVSGQNDMTHDAGLLPINLSITKTVNNPAPLLNSNVVFTVSVTNAGGYSPATDVTVSDVLPPGLTFVSATPASGTSYNSSTGVWDIGNLASGASSSLILTASVITPGLKTNLAQITDAGQPDVGTIHQASADVLPPPPVEDDPTVVDLHIEKTVNNPTPRVGTNVTFTITLDNAIGFALATGVIVTDLLPAGLTFVSSTPTPGTTYDAGTGIWNVGNLASGSSVTLTIIATAATPGVKVNTATVTDVTEVNIGNGLEASATVTPTNKISKALFLGR